MSSRSDAPLWRMLRAGGTGSTTRFAAALAAGAGAAGCAVALGGTAAFLISRAAQHPPVLYLMVAIVAVRACGVGRGVLRYAERLIGHDTALRVLTDLRVAVYRRLARLSPAGLTDLRDGDVAARLVADVDGLTDLWLRLLLPYAVAAVIGTGTVWLVADLVPAAGALLACCLLLVAVGAPLAAAIRARRAEARLAPLRGALTAGTVDLLHGTAELTAHGTLDAGLAVLGALDARLARAERRAAAGQGTGAALTTLAGGAAVLGALLTGAAAVRAGTLPPVLLAVVVLTPLAVHEVVAGVAPAAAQLPRLRAAARRLTEVMDRPDPVTDPTDPAPTPPPPYDLRLRDVTAGWTPGGPDVLRHLDLTVPAGARVAILGRSGAGKSTLAAVLLRFVAPRRGRINLAGTDLTSLTGEAVRRVIGLCAQDAHVFDTTLTENVRLARPDATDAQIRDALSRARLLDWVDTLPAGADTFVGEHGGRLSGGQRQRLALARALLADVPVLILDEPTEHLDEPTAAALTADLLTATAGRTVLLLTHRTTGLATTGPGALDQILTLESGRLVPAVR